MAWAKGGKKWFATVCIKDWRKLHLLLFHQEEKCRKKRHIIHEIAFRVQVWCWSLFISKTFSQFFGSSLDLIAAGGNYSKVNNNNAGYTNNYIVACNRAVKYRSSAMPSAYVIIFQWSGVSKGVNCQRACLSIDNALWRKPLRNLELRILPKWWPWPPFSQYRIISDRNIWMLTPLQFHFQFICGYELKTVFCSS